MIKILVAIPAYNCEKQISRVLAGFDESLINRVQKILVINNRSTDDTVAAAKKAISKLSNKGKFEIITNDANYNLGGSHKVAFLYGEQIKADYVAILHGDDQAKTTELNNLLDVAQNNNSIDAVLGTRFMKGSKLTGYSRERIWGNRILNVIYSAIALRSSRDLGSGLNLFKLETLGDHKYLGFADAITFNIDLLLNYFSKKAKLYYAPISWSETDQVSNARNFNVAWIAIKKLFLWRFRLVKYQTKKASDYTFKVEK